MRLNLGVRLLFFVLGFFLATTGPTLLTIPELGVSIYIYGRVPQYFKILNGYYTYLGMLLTAIGMVLIITAFYRREEKSPIIKTWFERECW